MGSMTRQNNNDPMPDRVLGMKGILYCDLMFFYTSVFCAGIQNIVTQMFFDTRYPAQKELLLPIALLLASLSTIGGIYASSGRFSNPPPGVLLLFLVATIGAFCGLFYAGNLVLYILLFCTASFCINFVYNVFDPFLGRITKVDTRSRHVRVLLIYKRRLEVVPCRTSTQGHYTCGKYCY